MSTEFVVCIEADLESDAALVRWKIYRRVPEEEGHDYIRVIDNSGEDYLYPSSWFMPIDLPPELSEVMVARERRCNKPEDWF